MFKNTHNKEYARLYQKTKKNTRDEIEENLKKCNEI